MGLYHIFAMGLGAFLVILGIIFLLLKKAVGPWWTSKTLKQFFWPGGEVYKRDERPGSYWIMVVLMFVFGFLLIFVGYMAHLESLH